MIILDESERGLAWPGSCVTGVGQTERQCRRTTTTFRDIGEFLAAVVRHSPWL